MGRSRALGSPRGARCGISRSARSTAEVEAREQARRVAEAAKIAAKVAEAEEQTIREAKERYDNELVPVDPVRVPPKGSYSGWSFADGKVIAVPRKDLSRLADLVTAEQEAKTVKIVSTRPPWAFLQGPPYGFGRESAIKLWAETASDEAIDFQLTLAAERKDSRVIELLHGGHG